MKRTLRVGYSVLAVVILANGQVNAFAAPGDLFATINGCTGNGVGAIYQYTPTGAQSTVASGLSRPRGLAFDSLGNLFVATTSCDAHIAIALCRSTILKITPDGAQEVFGTLPDSFFGEGVAIDVSDHVFVIAQSHQIRQSMIYKFTPDGARRQFAFLPPRFSQGYGLAFDSVGNLLAADLVAQTIYEFTPDGRRSTFVGPEAFGGGVGPIGLAFDAFDNLFVSARVGGQGDSDIILKFTPSGDKSTFATGLTTPLGLVFDSAGDLFVAEIPLFATGDILRFAPDGTRTVVASGIGCQEGFGGPPFLTVQR